MIRAIALSLALVAGTAVASQYPLEQAHAIISPGETARLKKAGLRTTLDLLTYGRTLDGRKAIAARSGIPLEKIAAWAAMADLMRVRGIGPDVARLLTAVGVTTLALLQKSDATATSVAIHDLNKEKKLSTNPPGVESISYWITQARGLPIVFEP
jgi:hypothetical protein